MKVHARLEPGAHPLYNDTRKGFVSMISTHKDIPLSFHYPLWIHLQESSRTLLNLLKKHTILVPTVKSNSVYFIYVFIPGSL